MNLRIKRQSASRSWSYSGRGVMDNQPEPRSFPNEPGLDVLASRLLAEQLDQVQDAALRERLRRAAAESASIAWATPYPLLTLPELFAEKEREARRQHERQQAIQRRDRAPLSHAE